MPVIRLCRVSGQPIKESVLATLSLACLLTACAPEYSPNIYSSDAVQHAAKVDAGVIIGVRKVKISADASIATATGGAAGGIAGSQAGTGAVSALGALGGSVAGGLIGNVVSHNKEDTFGYEYIVRKGSGDLASVTQRDDAPLKVGQHVLIIEGPQARIVNDYTVPVDEEPRAVKLTAPQNEQRPGEANPSEIKADESKPDASKPETPSAQPPSADETKPATTDAAPKTDELKTGSSSAVAPATATDTMVSAPATETKGTTAQDAEKPTESSAATAPADSTSH